nr:hypothetical protein [Tanacetum cinerariifolium]
PKKYKPTPSKKPKVAHEKPSKPLPTKKVSKGKVSKVRKEKSASNLLIKKNIFNLNPNLNLKRRTSTTLEESTGPFAQPQDDTSANIVRDTLSLTDAETGANSENTNSEAETEVLKFDEEKGEETSNSVVLKEKTVELDEGQAGSDPGKGFEGFSCATLGFFDGVAAVFRSCFATISKLVIQELIKATTEATKITLPLLPPPQQQSTIDSSLASHVLTLEQRCVDLEKKHKLQDMTTQSLSSRIFTLELTKDCPQSEQPIDDVPTPDDVYISDLEDTDDAHLPKVKPRAKWLKPIPEQERPKTPEPDWVIPANDLREPKKNWANALDNTYKDPKENKLLQKTSDMVPSTNGITDRLGRKSSAKLI